MTTVLAVILDVTDMTGRDPGGAVNAVVSAEFAVMIARTPETVHGLVPAATTRSPAIRRKIQIV